MSVNLYPAPFIFIRHGETDCNRERRTMGQTDIPLNNKGKEQAKTAISFLVNRGIRRIAHSPLKRAHQTAEIINQALKIPMSPVAGLKEFNGGIQEGCLRGTTFTTQAWLEGLTPEGAEPYP